MNTAITFGAEDLCNIMVRSASAASDLAITSDDAARAMYRALVVPPTRQEAVGILGLGVFPNLGPDTTQLFAVAQRTSMTDLSSHPCTVSSLAGTAA